MKVFISWSGEQSKEIAEAFYDWLPAAIQSVNPYFSPEEIEKGARWFSEISKNLEETNVGLICVTRENLTAPWLMFEAGALSKFVDKSKLCPILFGLEPAELKGPLPQFQATKFGKDEIKKFISTVNSALGDSKLTSKTLDSVFEKWWPELEEKIAKILSNTGNPSNNIGSVRSDREILEEILNLTRLKSSRPRNLDKRLHPGALRDLVEIIVSIREELLSDPFSPISNKYEKKFTKLVEPLDYLVDFSLLSEKRKDHLKFLIRELKHRQNRTVLSDDIFSTDPGIDP